MGTMTRSEHLQYCKDRALDVLEWSGRVQWAVVDMLTYIEKWDGGEMYTPEEAGLLHRRGFLEHVYGTNESCKNWINSFY